MNFHYCSEAVADGENWHFYIKNIYLEKNNKNGSPHHHLILEPQGWLASGVFINDYCQVRTHPPLQVVLPGQPSTGEASNHGNMH